MQLRGIPQNSDPENRPLMNSMFCRYLCHKPELYEFETNFQLKRFYQFYIVIKRVIINHKWSNLLSTCPPYAELFCHPPQPRKNSRPFHGGRVDQPFTLQPKSFLAEGSDTFRVFRSLVISSLVVAVFDDHFIQGGVL